jgi:hypothetical protein
LAAYLLLTGVARAEEPTGLPEPTPARPAPADLPPPGTRTSLVLAGAATTVVSYGLALGTSFLVKEDDLRGSRDLRIPVAGPWISLGRTGCPANDTNCSKIPLVIGAFLKAFDGIVQAGGLGIAAEGLFLRQAPALPRKAEGPTAHAVPLSFERGGLGVGFVGTF